LVALAAVVPNQTTYRRKQISTGKREKGKGKRLTDTATVSAPYTGCLMSSNINDDLAEERGPLITKWSAYC